MKRCFCCNRIIDDHDYFRNEFIRNYEESTIKNNYCIICFQAMINASIKSIIMFKNIDDSPIY